MAKANSPRSKSVSVIQTCNKFLDAAESIYIEHGYYGSSIRAIAKQADRNLGTLHHYWGSKEVLFQELFELRLAPVRDQHTKQLNQLQEQYEATNEVDLREIIRVLIEPFFFDNEQNPTSNTVYQLYSRVLSDAASETMEVMNNLFEEPIKIFVKLLRVACPDLSIQEFRVRMHFTLNAAIYQDTFIFESRMGQFIEAESAEPSNAEKIEYIINYLIAGLSAPATK